VISKCIWSSSLANLPFPQAVTWTTTTLSLIFIIFRLTSRFLSFSRLHWDDYLALGAWLLLLTSSIIFQAKIYLLYWLYDVLAGRTPFDENFLTSYGPLLKMVAVWQILFYTCLWLIKLSLLMFFRRLGSTVRAHRVWWWVVCGVLAATYIVVIADFEWECGVYSTDYIMSRCLYQSKVDYQDATYYVNLACDLVTDVLIVSIPVIIVWNVRIPARKKVLLVALFSATVLVMIAAIVRVALVRVPGEDMEHQTSIDWVFTWSNVEMCTAIMVSCLASFRRLFSSGAAGAAQYPPVGSGGIGSGQRGLAGRMGGKSGGSEGSGGSFRAWGKLGSTLTTFRTTITRGSFGDREEWDAERLDSLDASSQGPIVQVPMKTVQVRTTIATRSDLC
jgi:hypothetical protein